MKVTVTNLRGLLFILDVTENLELENFKVFCEIEAGFKANEIEISFNGRPLINNKKSLKDHGIQDGDAVILQHIESSTQMRMENLATQNFSNIETPSSSTKNRRPEDNPVLIREMFLTNPGHLALLKQNNPRLADALLSGSIITFTKVFEEQISAKVERDLQRVRALNSDPFDTEAQRFIAEEIRQKNIEANMEAAMEYSPESFGTVVMLYINCKVNGHPVQAFIDSGAQTTIMAKRCAKRCNLLRLVDTRWSGYAKGVGVQRILGRIHMVQMQIENVFLTASFSVMKEQPMDLLLGLDMLKRHQCCIDLQDNVLKIGATGIETKFLHENELPDWARKTGLEEEVISSCQKELEEQELQKSINDSQASVASTSRGNGSSRSNNNNS